MKNTIILICITPLLLLNVLGFAQTAAFSSNFEDQNMEAEIGRSSKAINQADMRVVFNPHPDAINSSAYVLKHILLNEGLQRRSEYTASRKVTNEKKYLYTWSVYLPDGMFTDVDPSYIALNQWKTWPCEAGPISNPDYQYFDTLICSGGGIFNDMIFHPEIQEVEYRVRAEPNCNSEFIDMPIGRWHKFILEVYWTNTENGYYRVWRNDTIKGYSDNLKTLPDKFIEGTCDIFWTIGLYSSWWKTGDETTDSVICYTDNIAIYDIDSGYTISSVCPDCEIAPLIPSDSSVYRININGSRATHGYNNHILSWKGETNTSNLSSTFGQSTGIDIYLPTDETSINNSLTDECLPIDVITTSIQWKDTATYKIYLNDLTPGNTYTFKLLSGTSNSSDTYGAQIWTVGSKRDTVLAADNTCSMAELPNLVSSPNGDLTINVKAISDANPRVYINSIEIVEYVKKNTNFIKNSYSNKLNIFPNPVSDNLFIKGETVPSNITIYSCDGRKVKYAENTNIVNISELKKGIYIVLVNMQESFATGKIIKE